MGSESAKDVFGVCVRRPLALLLENGSSHSPRERPDADAFLPAAQPAGQ